MSYILTFFEKGFQMFVIVDTPNARMILDGDRIEMVTLYDADLTIILNSKEGVMRNPITRAFNSVDDAIAVFNQLSSALVKT